MFSVVYGKTQNLNLESIPVNFGHRLHWTGLPWRLFGTGDQPSECGPRKESTSGARPWRLCNVSAQVMIDNVITEWPKSASMLSRLRFSLFLPGHGTETSCSRFPNCRIAWFRLRLRLRLCYPKAENTCQSSF